VRCGRSEGRVRGGEEGLLCLGGIIHPAVVIKYCFTRKWFCNGRGIGKCVGLPYEYVNVPAMYMCVYEAMVTCVYTT